MLGNKRYCYPLTISDYRSRYLLACEGLESTKSTFAFAVFERTFVDVLYMRPPLRTRSTTKWLFNLSSVALAR